MTTIRFTFDPKNPPKPTKVDLARMDAICDEDIDYSDIPELDAGFWANITPKKQP